MFLAVDRAFVLALRMLRGIEAVSTGFWLGLMRPRTLNRLTSIVYAGRPQYVDEQHNRSGLFDWEQAALERHFAGRRSIVVAACGGGRELLALRKQGHAVTGFDPDKAYVRYARDMFEREGLDANIVLSEPSEVPETIGLHDAAIVGWGAYTHIVGRQARVNFLAGLGRCLPVDAPILVSFWDRVPGYRGIALTRFVAHWTGRLTGNPREQELGDTLSRTFVHCFVEDEIRGELESAGFEMLSYSSNPYPHAIAVLRRHIG